MKNTYALIGCGWLGLPLAESWLRQGHHVIGTTRSQDKADQLATLGIQPQLFALGERLPPVVAKADAVVLNIPPGRKNLKPESFRQNIEALLAQVSSQTKLLFISTSSVFGQHQSEVDEASATEPDTPSGELHCQLEAHLHSHFGTRASVLRLAGLIGGDRHPVKMLAGRKLDNGQRPVNLIHRDDVINAINAIVRLNHWGYTLHLAANDHPSRDTFYTWAAKQAGLALPSFTRDEGPAKIIHSQQTQKRLGLTLAYPSPFDMPVPVSD
ncbi:Protein YeeZ [Saliniradius amylolyticus]|uniref:Protein YeeZ n=1 Tax=Saliniradius amylolyticus TaxID=2183582 RepID=A0A2S2DZW0_9ALTE|nr:SDR family oxidoreductase [Saliniradius amylolyticus]AWL10889.1 Protein YeeZ [Saliniradius amylolyticus]